MWNSPGFSKLSSNYTDLLFDEAANAEWCEFIAEKIRGIVKDPGVAEKLIPKDHRFGEKRPPFVTGYYEVFNQPERLARRPQADADRAGDRDRDRDGRTASGRSTSSCGRPASTSAPARSTRMGIRGRHGLALEDYWADGPRTFLGVQTTGFPNFFFPGGPHAAAGNNPRYNGDQVDFITDAITYVRDHGYDTIEVDAAAEDEWTAMVDRGAADAPFGESSYFFGTNIPGKPRKYLLNSGGRPKLFKEIAKVVESDYKAFRLSRSSDRGHRRQR